MGDGKNEWGEEDMEAKFLFGRVNTILDSSSCYSGPLLVLR